MMSCDNVPAMYLNNFIMDFLRNCKVLDSINSSGNFPKKLIKLEIVKSSTLFIAQVISQKE